MAWLPVITIALAFSCCIPQGYGSASKKAIFQNEEFLRYFLETVTDYLENYGVIQKDQERDILESYEGIIASLQKNQKGNKIKHAVASKIAELIVESVEDNTDVTYNLDGGIQATAAAFQDTIGSVDENFIETVRDMVAVMFNTDLEDEIQQEIEERNNAIFQELNQENTVESTQIQQRKETTTTTEDVSINEIEDIFLNTNTESDTYDHSIINSAFEEYQPYRATQLTENYFQESAAGSVSSQELITAISSTLATSNALTAIISGEISLTDIIYAASQDIAQVYGLSQEFVQSILTQYSSTYGTGTTAEEIALALASASSELLIQSGAVTPGQEQRVGQSVGSIMLSVFQQLQSQITRPAPAPAPRPLPAPRPAPASFIAQQTQQAASLSSASSAASTATTSQALQTSSASQFTAATSQTSSAVSVSNEALQTAIISNIESSSALNAISTGQLSVQNLISVASQMLTNAFGISQSSAQSILSQALSNHGRGSSTKALAVATASAISQLLVQSGAVTAGQEYSIGQSVGSNMSSVMQQLLSQITRPAPAPAPRPLPAPRPAPASFIAQQAQQASSSSSGTSGVTITSSSNVRESSSGSDYSSSFPGSQIPISPEYSSTGSAAFPSATGINTQELLSPVTDARISSLRGALSSAFSGGKVDFLLLSNAIAKTSGEIQHSSNLSESEVIVEALLETIAALIELLSPTASGSSSALAYNLVQVFG